MSRPVNIDDYLKKYEGTFAYPILRKIRKIVHEIVPGIEEAIKWGSPSFEYKGLMMSMVSFKNHVGVWFHKGALFTDPQNLLEASSEDTKSMRKYHIPTMDDLNENGLKELILEAVDKQNSGEQVKGFLKRSGKWEHSRILSEALDKDQKAKEEFEKFTPSKKREYIEHIESAKQDATKERRLKKDLELIRQGIGLQDKYRK